MNHDRIAVLIYFNVKNVVVAGSPPPNKATKSGTLGFVAINTYSYKAGQLEILYPIANFGLCA